VRDFGTVIAEKMLALRIYCQENKKNSSYTTTSRNSERENAMKKLTRITLRLMLFALISAAMSAGAYAQQYKLGWSVIGSGGILSAQNGGMRLSATVGQPAIGVLTDGKQKHIVGFWGGVAGREGTTGVEPAQGFSSDILSNFPNPMTASTMFRYQVPSSANVTLKVYDLVGRVVKTLVDEFQDSGEQKIEWNGKDEQGMDVSAGTYTYELVVSGGPGSVRYRQQLIIVR